MLTGCNGWGDGSYSSVQPHPTDDLVQHDTVVSVKDYQALYNALRDMVHSVTLSDKIVVADYEGELEDDLYRAINHIMNSDAITAYAVEEISCELGDMGSRKAVLINIAYHQNRTDILKIPQAGDMTQARQLIYQALDNCNAGIVFQVDNYFEVDFALMVQSYAEENPHLVMEQPHVTANIYPETGSQRVVELVFTYQTNRDNLRQMREYVAPVFEASRLNAIGEKEENLRFSRMYSFLAERNGIKSDASITPAYSLLRYGIGDSKSFALVFAAMCRNSQLECLVVSGTKDGNPYFWNMICQDGVYYHVDILREPESQELIRYTDEEMIGYVWDFDDYPACVTIETVSSQEE